MALATFPVADDGARPSGLDLDAASLVRLLSATADRDGRRLAFRDQKDRERWSGRPPLEWSYSVARTIVGRLSRFFSGLGLAQGSAVGVALSSGPEAWLSLLAIEDAGLAACLLPVGWPAEKLAQAIEAANVQAVATQGVLADLRPAELFCTLASRYFGLRFVCAFGPQIPDGVIDLDRVILVEEAAPVARTAEAEPSGIGRVTFSARAGEPRPIYRPARSFAASVISLATLTDVQADRPRSHAARPGHPRRPRDGPRTCDPAGSDARGSWPLRRRDPGQGRDGRAAGPPRRARLDGAGAGAVRPCGPPRLDDPGPPGAGPFQSQDGPEAQRPRRPRLRRAGADRQAAKRRRALRLII